jgi:protein involved in ribonucleotide reduction
MKSVIEVISHISESAKPRQDKRVVKAINPGQMIRQGDIYLICLGTHQTEVNVFKDVKVVKNDYTSLVKTNSQFIQLVPGSTMGSRHQVCSKHVEVFVNPKNTTSLVGPIIKAEKNFDLVHPEHAHFNLPAGEYLVCYQLNDKTKQRVRD